KAQRGTCPYASAGSGDDRRLLPESQVNEQVFRCTGRRLCWIIGARVSGWWLPGCRECGTHFLGQDDLDGTAEGMGRALGTPRRHVLGAHMPRKSLFTLPGLAEHKTVRLV